MSAKKKSSMSYKGLRKYYRGEWNSCTEKDLDDGSVLMILTSVNEDTVYRFRVKDPYGPNEEVLEYEEIKVSQPEHIKKRLKEIKWKP